MLNGPESEVNGDVLEFLSSIEKMTHSGRVDLLTALLKKYAVLGTSDIVLDKKDFDAIVSRSKQLFTEKTMPVELKGSETPIYPTDIPNLCVIETTIEHLNKLSCFKRIAKFEYIKR